MSSPGRSVLTAAELAPLLTEARTRTVELVQDLTDAQLIGPRLQIVNPLLWEIGHVAWFQEHWILRHHAGRRPLRPDADRLYDSAAVAHDTRWDLPLPSRLDTLAYLRATLERAVAQLESEDPSPELTYYSLLALFHEDMHAEAITYTRQTLAYPAPRLGGGAAGPPEHRALRVSAPESDPAASLGDASIPGGMYLLGASADLPFVFDNEKWAHPVRVDPFAISRTAVTNAQFAAFVEDAGYRRAELWAPEGWEWRERTAAAHPVYWRRSARGWERRHFDTWVTLERYDPVIHVNWFEADAYARWAGRRLPTEAEWELAASVEPVQESGRFASTKQPFPWGEKPPDPGRVNMDWRALGCLPVDALPEGDSAFGCRQMLGNVWEWTSTDFGPYPEFAADPYKEYSEPWFGDHKVLRGGGWTTRSRLIRNTWRNFYLPHRRDVWAGFRTCTSLPPAF